MTTELCGTEATQANHHAGLAEVETDFWFTRTFQKPLFLLPNTRVPP